MHRNQEPPRVVDQPEPGYFKLRLVKGGPEVTARIACQDGLWSAEINGVDLLPTDTDWTLAEGVARIWHYGKHTTRQDHQMMTVTRRWAEQNEPNGALANPMRPVDLNELPPIF